MEKVLVEYMTKPIKCSICNAIGHDHNYCPDKLHLETQLPPEDGKEVVPNFRIRNRSASVINHHKPSRGRSRRRKSPRLHHKTENSKSKGQSNTRNASPENGWVKVTYQKQRRVIRDSRPPRQQQRRAPTRAYQQKKQHWVERDKSKSAIVDNSSCNLFDTLSKVLQDGNFQRAIQGNFFFHKGETSSVKDGKKVMENVLEKDDGRGVQHLPLIPL